MQEVSRLRLTLAVLVLAAYALIIAGAYAVGLGIDYASILPRLLLLFFAFLVLNIYSRRMGRPRLLALSETLFGCVALATPVLIATYIAFRFNMPLADDLLARIDAAMMFDWNSFVAFIDDRPLLAAVLFLSYQSFAAQLLLLPILLCALRQEDRAYGFVIAFGILGLVSALISVWFPALSTYTVYGVAPEALAAVDAHYGYFFLEQFNGVRNDPNFVFSMDRAAGIVTFPSVHAGVAALCLWAAWRTQWLRYPFLALDSAMATAAISHGSHYLIDVLAGLLLAVVCIILTSRLRKPTEVAECNSEVFPSSTPRLVREGELP